MMACLPCLPLCAHRNGNPGRARRFGRAASPSPSSDVTCLDVFIKECEQSLGYNRPRDYDLAKNTLPPSRFQTNTPLYSCPVNPLPPLPEDRQKPSQATIYTVPLPPVLWALPRVPLYPFVEIEIPTPAEPRNSLWEACSHIPCAPPLPAPRRQLWAETRRRQKRQAGSFVSW
ncbi:hypothetical protein LZ31DRAFT_146431 [Colletotrichum somersetense]|nr:hypothetical protein LZ31DRAFT_146431 [Colletotrichum somersetense]